MIAIGIDGESGGFSYHGLSCEVLDLLDGLGGSLLEGGAV